MNSQSLLCGGGGLEMLMNGAFRLIGVEISVIVVLSDEFSNNIYTITFIIEIYNIEIAQMRIASFNRISILIT